ncbi:HNH endonuclease [Paracoccus tibetensis]|uniref:HNH endonuclease n=1 Tax=Paracoccus tibetensis TaxID=336292 RepID=A0A1G5BH18_9RHOB|nr:HNH endonuclease [Paracoccus tibetensis]SCX89230.1 HNH endonuclease [Paracoccus tibetensis]
MKGRAITYEPEELAWIEARKEMPRAELHAMFCAYWRRKDVTPDALKALCLRKGWETGRTGCFVKGQVPPNKGRRMPEHVKAKTRATMFKAGHQPANYRGPGHERVDAKDGYVILIVAERNPHTGADTRPVQKHRYLWEKAHGPVPEGYVLKCLDGDKTNTDPTNWTPIPKGMLPRLAGRWSPLAYDAAPAELKPTVMAVARLEHTARETRKAKR